MQDSPCQLGPKRFSLTGKELTAPQPRPPGDGINPPTAPTATRLGFYPRAHRQWWVNFMGDRVFASALATGKNTTKAGQARAKAEADFALQAFWLPVEYMDE